MGLNRRPSQPESRDDSVLVIGSGPTGATVAATLVEHGVPVTMIESSTAPDRGLIVRAAGNTVFRWTSERYTQTDRHSGGAVEWHSARALGGLTNYWTGSVPRFTASDFDEGARIHESYRWPIGPGDLVDDYDWAERILRVTGGEQPPAIPAPVVRHTSSMASDWRAIADGMHAGRAENGPSLGVMPMAKGDPWMVAFRATEFNAYSVMINPLRQDARFTLRCGQHAVRLERSTGSQAFDTVVTIDRSTNSEHRFRGRAIVLAAGALDTTSVLLRSRDTDSPDGLGNATGVLGRYLHDHPRQWWRVGLDRPMPALSHPLYLTRDDPATTQPLRGAGFTLGLADRSDRVRSWYRGSVNSIGVLTFGMTIPTPDDRVALDLEQPLDPDRSALRFDFAFDSQIEPDMDHSRHRFLALLEAGGIKGVEEFKLPVGEPGSSVHLGGTARMHDDPLYGVVDGANRVHDAPEVLVCDSACFTTGPEKNPTLTAMAIARRAARLLAARTT